MLTQSPAGRKQTPHHVGGFTLVELLIVIVVIAILATLAIIGYNSITQKAHVSVLGSDLSQAARQLGVTRVESSNGQWPQPSDAGLRSTSGDTLSYNVSADGTKYCVMASGWGTSYFITDDNAAPQVGSCSGTTGVPGVIVQVPTSYTVATIVGKAGVAGTTNGTGTNALLNNPTGIAVDGSGNLFVADASNNCIRKVTTGLVVTAFAGTCGTSTAGTNDGTGGSAQFSFPIAVTVDSSGNLFVTDNENCIREVTPAAVVTTFVGDCGVGVGGSNGVGRQAQFYNPIDTAFDGSGNLFVADFNNNCIREVSPGASVSYFAGLCASWSKGTSDGTGSSAQFHGPYGAKFDTSGNLYIAEYNNNCIRKITPAAVVTTFAGSCGATGGTTDGTGTSARFNGPQGLVFDAFGNMIVVDDNNNCIRKITPAAIVTTVAGSCGSSSGSTDGSASSARFNQPADIAVDSAGNLYVTDYGNTIRKLTPQY